MKTSEATTKASKKRSSKIKSSQQRHATPAYSAQISATPPSDKSTKSASLQWTRPSRRVPVLLQMNTVECGAACLAMILSYYGRKTRIAEVSEQCGVGRDGLSALDIVKAARSYALRVRALSLQDNNFQGITLPAIVHWQFNHFVIVERWSTQWVDIVDPALGRRRVSSDEFNDEFTGVVLLLEPTPGFTRSRATRRTTTLRNYAFQYIRCAPFALAQILLVTLLLQMLGLAFPLLTKIIIDTVIGQKRDDLFLLLGIGSAIILLSQLIMLLLRSSLLIYLEARIDTHVFPDFFAHLFSLPYKFFLKHSNGDLLTRFNSQAIVRSIISSQLISTLLDGSLVIFYLVILLMLSPLFGLTVVAIGLLDVLLLLGTGAMLTRLARQELETVGKEQGYLNEVLAGIETLKATGLEGRALSTWSRLFFARLNASLCSSYTSSVVGIARGSLQGLAPLVLLWIGAVEVLQHSLQLGSMLALNTLAISFLTPLSSLVGSAQQLQFVRAHLERIADIAEAEPEQRAQARRYTPRLRGSMRLDNVSFRYDPSSPVVLRNISLSIQPGQKVALVGRTGSGKSTLGRLLLGLYTPTEGEIFYDNLPLHALNYQDVRSQCGAVLQNAHLFSGSIRQNITFDLPDLTMEDVVVAARLAELHEDVEQMPMAYETFVSENGNALSGGQRQRLALARALVRRPALLLLDEATSALDVETERRVEQHLNGLSCTQIVIAHRLSTIRNADCILVLHEGQLVEQGTHTELLHKQGFYASLIASQLANGEVEV